MPLKSKKELSQEAVTLATSFSLVRYNQVTYIPVDFETGDWRVTPDPERTSWIPLNKQELQIVAKEQFDTLFYNEAERMAFDFMVAQFAYQYNGRVNSLLVKTASGLKELRPDGKLHEPTGAFIPNTLKPILNEDPDDKAFVMSVLTDWVDAEEEAVAMLRHFATALAPGWSAVKYVLLMGDGRNGKSLMMEMLVRIFGRENCSHVSRQDISDKSPVVTELNGKLLNLVFDGQADYLKDSGLEKSLVAGEVGGIRRLYQSELTPVQTNALFVEGLNTEPKSKDKTSALQARLVRFWFPKVFDEDSAFKKKLLSEKYVGALLALLIDNYVQEDERAVMLAPTALSKELQLEHMFDNSLAMQFIKHVDETDPLGADSLIGMDFSELIDLFRSWRVKENDLSSWPEPTVFGYFRPVLSTERRSKRVNGQPRKARVISAFKKDTVAFLATMREEDAHATAVVHE